MGPELSISDISDTLYFSNNKIILDKRRGIETWEVDLPRLGLPNDDFEVQYLPRGSAVFIQEADILAFCRDWETLNNYLVNLIKFVRHNLITLFFDMQVGGALDKALRRLLVGMYYVVKSGVSRFFIFWKRQKWKFLYIRNQLNNDGDLSVEGIKAYCKAHPLERPDEVKKHKKSA